MATQTILHEHQRLPTSGARTALPFRLEGALWLAVPQLAEDVESQAPHMNGGDSDVDLILYRWTDGRFVEADRLPGPGGEDVAVFDIAGETFLAVASIRTGSGPYDANAHSHIYRREARRWVPFQAVETFGAKQWHPFRVGGRHFLALAQGLTLPQYQPRGPAASRIFEWREGRFEPFQELDGRWGYNWCSFALGGDTYLGYADHVGPSMLLRWDGECFTRFQTLSEEGGRAYQFFERDGGSWLAFATIDGDSVLYRWDGYRFAPHQTLGEPGGREFALIRSDDSLRLVRIRFIEGTPRSPKTDLQSEIFDWNGSGFDLAERFATFGGTDAATFEADGARYLAVANSLTPDVRFRQDSVIYRLAS